MIHKRFRDSWQLWLLFAIVLFVIVGFIDWTPDGIKGGEDGSSYWHAWEEFLDGQMGGDPIPNIVRLIVFGLILFCFCALAGWVIQACVVVAFSMVRAKT